jgi:dihydroorotase
MEKHDLVLNLHGEMISTPASAVGKQTEPVVTVLNAEPLFIPQLAKLHAAFPKLRIILEHVSTKQGLDAVRACGPNVSVLRILSYKGGMHAYSSIGCRNHHR